MSDSKGFRSQPLWMKAMLLVSLVFIVLGVYRCSTELTPPEGPGVIAVRRATFDLSDDRVAIPPDSVAALATRQFVRELRSVSGSRVVVGGTDEAWAVVRLHLGDGEGGRIVMSASARSAIGGRVFASVSAESPPDSLRDMAARVAREVGDSVRAPVGEDGGSR